MYITTRPEWPHRLTTCSRAAHNPTKTCTIHMYMEYYMNVRTTLGLVVTVTVYVRVHSIDPLNLMCTCTHDFNCDI